MPAAWPARPAGDRRRPVCASDCRRRVDWVQEGFQVRGCSWGGVVMDPRPPAVTAVRTAERRATCRLSADPDARGEQGAPQEGLSVPCARCTHTCVVKASGHSREESGSLRPLPCCPSSAGRPMGAPRSAPALGPRPSVAPRRCQLPLLLVLLCGLCGPPRAQSAGTAGTTPQPTAWASGSTGGLRWLRGAAGARAGVRQEGTVRFEVADSFYRAHSKVIRCEPRPPLPEPRPRCAPARRRC